MIAAAVQPRAMSHTSCCVLLSISLALACHFWSVCADFPAVFGDESSGFGPVFEEQPVDTIYPEESPEDKIIMSCRTRANPPATYRWRLDNTEIVIGNDDHYSLMGGNLVISFPDKSKHAGNYSCLASNEFGTLVSQKASVQFGYLDMFSSDEREAVYVKEGQGAVLLCAPPPHFPEDLSFRWMLNEFPEFILLDKRRFVSQTTGNLYISTVRASDSGNYSCFVSSPSIAKSVFSKFIPLVPIAERDPIPQIRWRKVDGDLPVYRHNISMSGSLLHLYDIQYEDESLYECEADNSKGKDRHKVHLYVEGAPEWVEKISSSERDIGGDYIMSCLASGKPKPHVHFLKNGRMERHSLSDEGKYTCFAENDRGRGNSTGSLSVTDATKITLAPSNADISVGESTRMECAASHDPTLDLTFIWSLDAHAIDFDQDREHYERKMVISVFSFQYRDVRVQQDWRDASTSPVNVEGNAEMASVINLTPWTEYEFRVIATNTLGTGPPSDPSPNITTREARPVVAPSEIGGGGGTSRELTITWTVPVLMFLT
ncbi:contactin-1a-like [Sinocyclocheilus anshuiensis]|uniref:contactin-1a-like n=1 Tax=Sinocyclocheilus anshuiensis TaxID=1608454 RepID=UPI0007BA44A8|nr:PREDICTED: contactin-1a-like [Sinocyclocheilus anshuiensis]